MQVFPAAKVQCRVLGREDRAQCCPRCPQRSGAKALGWRVVQVWECEIKTVAQREEYLKRLYDRIVNPAQSYLIGSNMDELSIAAEPESERIYGDNNHS